jgi:hypothetical protein
MRDPWVGRDNGSPCLVLQIHHQEMRAGMCLAQNERIERKEKERQKRRRTGMRSVQYL